MAPEGISYWLQGGNLCVTLPQGYPTHATARIVTYEQKRAPGEATKFYIAPLLNRPGTRAVFWARTLHELPQNPPWSCPQCGVWLGLGGSTPIEPTGSKVVDINKYRWEKHCRGLFEKTIAA